MLNKRMDKMDKIDRDLRIYDAIELALAILTILALSFASTMLFAAVPDQELGEVRATTVTLARSANEVSTGVQINRAWAAGVADTASTETVTGYWTFTQGNFDNIRIDGNTISTTSGDMVTSPTGSFLIGPATGQNVLIDWDSADAWVQFRSASTVQFELRNDGGIWELNRGANSSNSIAISGASMGIGGDTLPDAALEVVDTFYVSATAAGDGDSFKVVNGLATIGAGDSAATVNTAADDLTIEASGTGGMSILTPAATTGQILFGRPTAATNGRVEYSHATDKMTLYAGNAATLRVGATAIELVEGQSFLRGDYWTSKTVSAATDGTTFTVAAATVGDGYMVKDCVVEIVTPGVGTSYELNVGDGTGASIFIAGLDPAVVSAGYFHAAKYGTALPNGKIYSAADTVDIAYSGAGDDTDLVAIVWVHISRLK